MDDTSTLPSPSVYFTAIESGPAESPHPFRSPLASNSPSTQDTDATPRASGYQAAFGLLVENTATRKASPIMLRRYVDEHGPLESSTPHLSAVPLLEATPVAARLRRSPRLSSTPKPRAQRSPYLNSAGTMTPLSAGTTPRRSARISAARDATSSAASTASFLTASSSVVPLEPPIVHSPLMRPQLSGVAMAEPAYPTALSIAVDQHVSSLTTLGCGKEAQAFMALHAQSKKDPGSAVLLDGLLRGCPTARQARDFERYTNEFMEVCEGKRAPENREVASANKVAPSRAGHGTREILEAVVIDDVDRTARYDIDVEPTGEGTADIPKMEAHPSAAKQAPVSVVQHKHNAQHVPRIRRKARRNKRAGLKRAKKFGTMHRVPLILSMSRYGSGLQTLAAGHDSSQTAVATAA